jgi:hypothetical protein
VEREGLASTGWRGGEENSASPFIGRGWGCSRACAASRGAVLDGAAATRARGWLAWSGALVAGSGMLGGLRRGDGCGRANCGEVTGAAEGTVAR